MGMKPLSKKTVYALKTGESVVVETIMNLKIKQLVYRLKIPFYDKHTP